MSVSINPILYHYNYRSHISLQVAKLVKSAGVKYLFSPLYIISLCLQYSSQFRFHCSFLHIGRTTITTLWKHWASSSDIHLAVYSNYYYLSPWLSKNLNLADALQERDIAKTQHIKIVQRATKKNVSLWNTWFDKCTHDVFGQQSSGGVK